MKLLAIFLLAFVPMKGQAQKDEPPSRNVYKTVQGLNLVDTITWEKVKQDFSFGDPMVGYGFHLDSNKTYKYIEFGDISNVILDHGRWKIKKNSILVLKSRTTKYNFDVVRFGWFLFYISPEQRLNFVTDLKREENSVANFEIKLTEPRYTREFFVAFALLQKFYGTEIIH